MIHTAENGFSYRIRHNRPDSGDGKRARWVTVVSLLDANGDTLSIECPNCGGETCLLCDETGRIEVIGTATCHPRDPFNRKLGREIALGRALHLLDPDRLGHDIERHVPELSRHNRTFANMLLVAASEVDRGVRYMFVHPTDNGPASHVVMSLREWSRIQRFLPDPFVDDDNHDHVTPEMLDEPVTA